jgi:hypothetical protein
MGKSDRKSKNKKDAKDRKKHEKKKHKQSGQGRQCYDARFEPLDGAITKKRPKKEKRKKKRKKRSRKHRRGSSGEDSDSDDSSSTSSGDAEEVEEWRRFFAGGAKAEQPAVGAARAPGTDAAAAMPTAAELERRRKQEEAAGTRYMRRGEKVPRAPKPNAGEVAHLLAVAKAKEDAKMDHFRQVLGQELVAPVPEVAPLQLRAFSSGGATGGALSRTQRQLDSFGTLRNFKGQLK